MKSDREVARKRKIDEAKWLGNKEVKHSHIPNPSLPQQRQVANHVDDSNNSLLEGGGTADPIYGHSLYPSVLHGPVTGSIHENVVGSLAGPGAGISASADGIHAGISAGTDVVMQGGSYAGGHGGSQVNSTTGQMGTHAGQLYGSRGDAAVYDRLPSHCYAYRPSSYLECSGSMGLPNTILGDAYRPPPYMESSKGLPSTIHGDVNRVQPCLEGSMGLPNTITGDAFRPPPYLGGSTGLPNTIPPPYRFVDTVPATELYRSSSSQAVDAVASTALVHPSSSMYWQR